MTTELGFFVESLAVTGAGLPAAELSFRDGLNVISGASDTGKSYALKCIDFALGASQLPVIAEAQGYEQVELRLRLRTGDGYLEITRSLDGGDVQLRTFGGLQERLLTDELLRAEHSPDRSDTLSGRLLHHCGLYGRRIRLNAEGRSRTLSYRDLAHLTVVHETRMISERPPYLGDQHFQVTPETDVFRLLLTGVDARDVLLASVPETVKSARNRAAELDIHLAMLTSELTQLGVERASVPAQLAESERVREAQLRVYEEARSNVLDQERQLARIARRLREVNGEISVAEGLRAKFNLLDEHYASDLARLELVVEAGSLLGAAPRVSCPLCGASPADQRGPAVESQFAPAEVSTAAYAESSKVARLRTDLGTTRTALNEEIREATARRDALAAEVATLQASIESDLRPRVVETSSALRAASAHHELLLKARTLLEQVSRMEARAALLKSTGPRKSAPKAPKPSSGSTVADAEGFRLAVQHLLQRWRFPGASEVLFSDREQDLIIGGQPRASHGKGVRAITCAAFLTGLMRYCMQAQRGHPGCLMLDSPLVVYRDPDSATPEEKTLMLSGVQRAFYDSLASGDGVGQVIVAENIDLPDELRGRAVSYHFTATQAGRNGFFPRP